VGSVQRFDAPRQGWEGVPNAPLKILPAFVQGLDGIKVGEDIWIFTWLHEAQRSILKTHPRDDLRNPRKGVFATRASGSSAQKCVDSWAWLINFEQAFWTGNLGGQRSPEFLHLQRHDWRTTLPVRGSSESARKPF
jgi:tRNA (L-threonylcarbamoyladenosine(37)-C2) methyltransferase TrmO-like protein